VNSAKSQIDRLALGTVQFGLKYGVANRGEKVTLENAKQILRHAYAVGINTIDTAIAYGDSEQRLGEIGIKGLQVVTKLPSVPKNCSDIQKWIYASVTESLARLNVEKLAGLLLHTPLELLTPRGGNLYAGLQNLKQDGIVDKIGISIYDPAELDAVCNRYSIDLVQAPFHILDRRLIHSGWMDRLERQGTELHVRSVFLQGLLLMNASDRPPYFSKWESLWNKWDQWLETNNITPLAACLGYALSFPQIKKIVVGVDLLEHLTAIIDLINQNEFHWPNDISCDDTRLINPSQWVG